MSDGPGLAVVTGAARGIGAAVGMGLAEEGFSLLLIDACVDQAGIPYSMPARADLDDVAERCEQAGAPAVD
jgi:NAD(P)-dependent dehydrogenase (short-subunit alcohol dehydrogenase family)